MTKERRKRALAMGGPEKLKRRRDAGLLNARERIDHRALLLGMQHRDNGGDEETRVYPMLVEQPQNVTPFYLIQPPPERRQCITTQRRLSLTTAPVACLIALQPFLHDIAERWCQTRLEVVTITHRCKYSGGLSPCLGKIEIGIAPKGGPCHASIDPAHGEPRFSTSRRYPNSEAPESCIEYIVAGISWPQLFHGGG